MDNQKELKASESAVKNEPVKEDKPKNKKKSKSNKWLYLGLGVSLFIIVVGLITYGAVRLYRFQATDGFTVQLTKYIPYPAASVNGHYIRYYTVKTTADTLLQYQEYLATQYPDNELHQTADYSTVLKKALEFEIENAFVKTEAKELNINLTQEEIDKYLKLTKEDAEANGQNFEQVVKDVYGWTVEQFTENGLKPQILRQKLGTVINNDLTIAKNKESKDKISSIRQDIVDGKITFDDTAKANSEDKQTAAQAGDLGYAEANYYAEEFAQALTNLKVDEVSQPVRTYFGWHLIKLIEKIEEEGKAIQYHAKHILIAGVDFEEWLAQQISQAKIKRFIDPK